MKCPNCKRKMEKVRYDVGYKVKVDSFHCNNCGFNVTEDNKLKKALSSLREEMAKDVKIIGIGEGLGIRLPNEMVKSYHLKKGKIVSLMAEEDGMKIRV